METEKRGISQITGKTELKLGEKAYYKVTRIHREKDHDKVKNALWKLYVKENGNWRELKPNPSAPPKKGAEIPLTITNQSLVGKELMVEAYIYEPEMKAPPGLKIKVVAGGEKKIHRVELFMVDDTPIKENTILKYNQTIKVKIYTQNMPRELLKLSLYEDDADGGGHNPKNEKNKVAETTKYTNEKGFLWHEFNLKAEFSKIANAMMDGSHDKLHEYYVLVESAKHGRKTSKNVEVENPDYVVHQTYENGKVTDHKNYKIYDGGVIEEVIIIGKYKKQMGIDPIPNTGRSVSIVSEPPEKEKNVKCPNCEKEITIEEVNKVLGDQENQTYRVKIVSLLNEYIDKRKGTPKELHINTCLRKAHFLSEIATETSLLEKKLTEGNTPPYYSENNIKTLWPGKYNELVKSGKLSLVASERPQKQLLNIVYGHKNGNKGGNDGWNYRGKGLIQLTGRTNYKDASDFLDKVFPEEYIDLEVNYDKVAEIKYAVLSSIAFWEGKSVYNIADVSKTKESVPNVRFLVNSFDKDNARTKKYFENALDAFKVDECKKDKVEKKGSKSKVKLDFVGKTAKESALSEKTKNVLREVGEDSGNYYIAITSTARTSHDQARIMYDNCKANLQEQRRTYKTPGQRVIDVYENNRSKPRDTVIKLMEQKINELGPSTVSKHLANPEVLNTFDISYGNLADKTKFWNEMKKRPELDDILKENNCYHIQIKQK